MKRHPAPVSLARRFFRLVPLSTLALTLPLAACGDDDDGGPGAGLVCGTNECSASQYCLVRTAGGATTSETCEARPSGCTACECVRPDDCPALACIELEGDLSVTCSM
jgi:hypothetical protein